MQNTAQPEIFISKLLSRAVTDIVRQIQKKNASTAVQWTGVAEKQSVHCLQWSKHQNVWFEIKLCQKMHAYKSEKKTV